MDDSILRLYFGSFTGGFMGGAESEGIYVWELNTQTLEVAQKQVVDGLFSPSFLCRHPQLSVLYGVERQWSDANKDTGALTTFAISDNGELHCVDRRPTEGAFTAHVSVSLDGSHLSVANPLGPNIAVFPLDEQGIPGTATACIAFEGRGARPRQAAPWPHSTYTDAAGRRLFACDLALDRVFVYDIDPQSKALQAGVQPYAQVSSGAGARHLAQHPSGRFLCVANELDGTLSVFEYDPREASVTIVQTVSALPAGVEEPCQPTEVSFSSDGRHLYVSNRGVNAIGVFAVDQGTGRVRSEGMTPVQGDTPRHHALSPDNQLMLVANQLSGEVVIMRRDEISGELTATGVKIPVPSVSCVVFG